MIKTLQKNLNYIFHDELLIMQALTHRSKQKNKGSVSASDHVKLAQRPQNNERLEFLGDSVLSLIISTDLFHRYPKINEGELSRLRAALVKGETIAKIAHELGIGDCLQLGVGELKSGGNLRESILSGAFEAVIGAIYCDSNFEVVQQCVLQWYKNYIEKISHLTDVKDAKTILQEWLQAKQMPLPVYESTVTGDAHQQEFTVTCHVEGLPHKTKGVSTSRKKAEQIAAKQFLVKL